MSDRKESDLVEIAALWENKSANGATYFSGYLGNAKLLVFANNFKEQDKHPDYRVFVAPKEKNRASRDDAGREPGDDSTPW